MSRLLSVTSALILAGCAFHEVHPLSAIDRSDKIALVPPGSFGVIGEMKAALARNGWTLIVSTGDQKVTGKIAPDIDVKIGNERSPRYTFLVEQHTWNPCLIGANALRYEISIIDTRTGGEVHRIKGRGDCWFGRNDAEIAEAIDGLR
ncbi:hypothetical protein [Magnetospirillum molischianum]|uniref:Lipoprotein n=1 Tax=Magnetospirillum molischianum DSM 120 TaxID=1150626 RepID=H8FP32_MAGML|nr:hypothetical protein [Magnetospirillum molischianum]CCG40120.1 exported hypothetical protein [Magnetospirillum molischianum DSM 120]